MINRQVSMRTWNETTIRAHNISGVKNAHNAKLKSLPCQKLLKNLLETNSWCPGLT